MMNDICPVGHMMNSKFPPAAAGRRGHALKGVAILLVAPYISPINFCGQGITNPVFIGIYGNIITIL